MEFQNIQGSLMYIQEKLKAPKKQFNKFGNYPYRNLEDIMESVKPLLFESRTTLKVSDSVEYIGDRHYVKSTATLTFVQEPDQTISVSAYAREEENKKGFDSAQLTGSTSSYSRKYALNGLFCIDDTKDSDTTNTGESKLIPEPKKTTKEQPKGKVINNVIKDVKDTFDKHHGDSGDSSEPKKEVPEKDGEGRTETGEKLANEKQIKLMFFLAKEKNWTSDLKFYLKSELNIDNSAELTHPQVSKIITMLQGMEKVE